MSSSHEKHYVYTCIDKYNKWLHEQTTINIVSTHNIISDVCMYVYVELQNLQYVWLNSIVSYPVLYYMFCGERGEVTMFVLRKP